jgi:hypothetical protein
MTKKRIKGLEFHIQEDDYFGTLATVLDLLRQDADLSEIHTRTLVRMRDDLVYLQTHYSVILKKPK